MHDDLHWLVIPQRVQYKLVVAVHRYLRHRAQRYLADYCVPVYEVRPTGSQHLRSAISYQLSALGPVHFLSAEQGTVWNSLRDHLRDPAVDPEQ